MNAELAVPAYIYSRNVGPLPPWAVIVVGAVFVLVAVALMFGSNARGGFGTAPGSVVEIDRPGNRPTLIEFTPANGEPTRVKHGGRLALHTRVTVQYSLADPRNARVDPRSPSARRGISRRIVGAATFLIGLYLLVRGIAGAA